MSSTFTRLGILAAMAVTLGLGVVAPAKADWGWRGPPPGYYRYPGWHHRPPPPPRYYAPPPRYYAPPPVYYAPPPVYRYVPPPPVYYAPPAIGFGVTIY